MTNKKIGNKSSKANNKGVLLKPMMATIPLAIKGIVDNVDPKW